MVMRAAGILLIVIFSVSVVNIQTAFAAQDPFYIYPQITEITSHAGKSVSFIITVKNNNNLANDYSIDISGEKLEFYFPTIVLLNVDAASSKNISLQFYTPVETRGNFVYDATIYPIVNPDFRKTEKIYLNILDPFILNNMEVNKLDNRLDFTFDLESVTIQNVNIIIQIKDKDGNVLNRLETLEEVEEKDSVPVSMTLPDTFLSGTYFIDIKLVPKSYGEEIAKTREFVIESKHKITESTERISSPLYDIINVYITNNGNVEESEYVTYQPMTKDFMTGFVSGQPESCEDLGRQKTCKYVIKNLAPGQTAKITYREEYWPTYLQFGIFTLIIIVLVGVVVMRTTKPTLRKAHARRGNEHTVTLEIDNPFFHTLGDVTIRDWVSPIGNVSPAGYGSVTPVIRKTEAGTELIWKLGEIRPRDHRILSYRIDTALEGTVRVPRASMRYYDKKGRTVEIFSKTVSEEG